MISIQGLSRSFGTVKAVDNLSFNVEAGEVFALLGPNGAGKTTTIKMILGMLRPDEGRLVFDGKPITPDNNNHKARIGYVPESCALYDNLSGREYLAFMGNLHHLPSNEVNQKIGLLLEAVELDDSADKLIREYSKGMKQKILMISALIHDPDLIVLDEPFSGLDANAVLVFKELIYEQARLGKAIVFCSHILEVVERIVDRALIMKDGRQLACGTPSDIISLSSHNTLSRAFNELTGSRDVAEQARSIAGIIRNSHCGQSNE